MTSMRVRAGRPGHVGKVLVGMVALLAVSLAGCGRGEPESDPTPTEEGSEAASDGVDRSRKFVAKVRAVGTGAAAFTWEGEREIILTRVGRTGLDVNLVSAGFAQPEILPDDRAHRFRWAFDLLNAYADQPGSFTIDGAPQGQQGLRSQAFLIWMQVKDPAKDAVFEMSEVNFLNEFNQIQQPCTLEIGEGERTGTLTCPALATKDGEVAGFTVSWEQTGPDQPT